MPYQTTYNLDELFGSELDKVVAYYYEVTDEEAKKMCIRDRRYSDCGGLRKQLC